MSLILEALRKSEAERRRGNLPALALELPPPPPRTMPTRAWWMAIPVTLVLAAGVLWMARPVDVSPPSLPAVAASAPVRATPAPQPVAAQPVDTIDSIESGGAAVAGSAVARVTVPAPTAPVPAPVPTEPTEPDLKPEPRSDPTPPVATTEVPEPGDIPTFALSDLTADERRALPPLKLSMHMWAPAPADRFVILDGHRLGEGDRAGNAVVARIDPDGVILAANGRRIRLPLP